MAAVTAYSDDLTDLQFDAATAAGHLLKLLDAENAHAFGVWAARHGLVPRERRPDPPCLRTAVWGRTFRNPIGKPLPFLVTSKRVRKQSQYADSSVIMQITTCSPAHVP